MPWARAVMAPSRRVPEEEQGSSFHRFDGARPIGAYLGQPGPYGGNALPGWVLQSRAESLPKGLPDEFAAIGFDRDKAGVEWLRFETTRAYIEAVTDYRHREGRLRLVCPSCGLLDGKHKRGCTA